ncbi:MAG: AAA family ATPase [gamma proteobacterium endosymbiont of Lamellibrachia anaximandri]|nr:AAA family ATPase [gamma proteobacterium endosymbiont of Lamellibrachia anaximandri]MBL3535045.1 AAA family ATPase [gamma proteobacterium endosymbiont of Lamellibrachia anaximandri]
MQFSDFGFQENPFSITPDPRYLYLSRGHEESLAHLIYGTGPNGGFVQLTGEVGTGKTMLVRSLLEQNLENVDIALIFNPRLSRRAFMAAICDELGIKYVGPPYSLKQLTDNLSHHLLKTHAAGRNTVLVVDEAQNLSPRVLEQVRMLTNLETSQHKLLRIILVGQPELQQLLARKDMRQVAQRITARYHLFPLSRRETVRYIRHRLTVSGNREDLFTSSALRLVYHLSRGVPRIINTICERTLLAIFATDAKRAGPRLVWRAAREVRGSGVVMGKLGRLMPILLIMFSTAAIAWFLMPLFTDSMSESGEVVAEVLERPAKVEHELSQPPLPSPEPEVSPVIPSESGAKVVPVLSQTETAPAVTVPPVPETIDTLPEAGLEIDLERQIAQVADSKRAVHLRLFELWGKQLKLRSSESACKEAPPLGLRCLTGIGGWEDLERINRPLLLKLKLGYRQRYILLKSMQGENLTVDYGEGERRLKRADIAPLWPGDYVVLWRPRTKSALVGPGSTGVPVTWLRTQLAKAEGLEPPVVIGRDAFNVELRQQLKRFQSKHGLSSDGVAGQQTMITLNNVQLTTDTPTLRSAVTSEGGEG